MEKIKSYLIHLLGGVTIIESKHKANMRYKVGYSIGYDDGKNNNVFNDNLTFEANPDFIKEYKKYKKQNK